MSTALTSASGQCTKLLTRQAAARALSMTQRAPVLRIEGLATPLKTGVPYEHDERLSAAPAHDRGHEPAQSRPAHPGSLHPRLQEAGSVPAAHARHGDWRGY